MKACWDCGKSRIDLVRVFSPIGDSYCCHPCLEKLQREGVIKSSNIKVWVREMKT